ncbi:hypothetical protein GCM10028803_60290 [Larkinella knui]|uniref:Lipoprotein n=1 Tax=Larkinella knui TaxID=2025310 RepID=A0A3P1CAL5_9BACT|nr:hypothetical protein [Larkinella knui]RRB10371.1 hypothetical protein EHT87_29535 [Larkinella knui]
MNKNLVLIYCLGWLLTACVSNHITWNANSAMKKVTIGMSKEQVIQLVGDDYMIASSSKDDKGNHLEVLAYKSDVDEEYKLKFINSRLMGWSREHINKYPVPVPSS